MKRRISTGLGLAIAFLALTAPMSASSSSTPGTDGHIAFVSNRTGNNDIYVVQADGTGLVDVTNNPASDRLPAWAPDGSKLVFRSTRTGNAELFVMNGDGSGVTQITFAPSFETAPSWTPEGRILFSSDRSGRFELYEVNADGSDVQHIPVDVDGALLFATASAEGHRISFTSILPDETTFVWTVQRDGSHPRAVTDATTFGTFSAWSSRGNRIAFSDNVCSVCDLSRIVVINQVGNARDILTEGQTNDLYPRWSPDGTWLSFDRSSPATFFRPDVYVMAANGSGLRNLTPNTLASSDVEAVWGP